MPKKPQVTDALVRTVANWEGYRANPYWDVDHYSHGYGTKASGPGAPPISREDAARELRDGLNEIIDFIPRKGRLRRQEIDALASFGYNLGPKVLVDTEYSTLARRLRSPEGRRFDDRRDIYHDELRKWNMPGSMYEAGLTKRRLAETKIARNGEYP